MRSHVVNRGTPGGADPGPRRLRKRCDRRGVVQRGEQLQLGRRCARRRTRRASPPPRPGRRWSPGARPAARAPRCASVTAASRSVTASPTWSRPTMPGSASGPAQVIIVGIVVRQGHDLWPAVRATTPGARRFQPLGWAGNRGRCRTAVWVQSSRRGAYADRQVAGRPSPTFPPPSSAGTPSLRRCSGPGWTRATGRLRDHGSGAAGGCRAAPARQAAVRARDRDERAVPDHQQGVPVRPERGRSGRPADPGGGVRHRGGRRDGVDDLGPAPAAQVADRHQVRRPPACWTIWPRTGSGTSTPTRRWAR